MPETDLGQMARSMGQRRRMFQQESTEGLSKRAPQQAAYGTEVEGNRRLGH